MGVAHAGNSSAREKLIMESKMMNYVLPPSWNCPRRLVLGDGEKWKSCNISVVNSKGGDRP